MRRTKMIFLSSYLECMTLSTKTLYNYGDPWLAIKGTYCSRFHRQITRPNFSHDCLLQTIRSIATEPGDCNRGR